MAPISRIPVKTLVQIVSELTVLADTQFPEQQFCQIVIARWSHKCLYLRSNTKN